VRPNRIARTLFGMAITPDVRRLSLESKRCPSGLNLRGLYAE
jgi:hypothetical protein